MRAPSIVVLSTLFPSATQPGAGLFIRERMFRVGEHLPLTVVAPQAWFPGQSVIAMIRSNYRIASQTFETQSGFDVYRPRAICAPRLGRRWDGRSIALAALPTVRRLIKAGKCDIIDAHFAYPDGYAASLLGKWFDLPVCVTLRGTEPRHLSHPALRSRVLAGLHAATRVFSVSNSLRQLVVQAGIVADKIEVIGNGVDTTKFFPVDRHTARATLGIPLDAKVMITVGALVERKGFHRVIAQMPKLLRTFPNLVYLIIGGVSSEGDWSLRLRRQVKALDLAERVKFLGAMKPEALRLPLSAADVAVLASSNEGWANVILEAMACGVPVVASNVGGNAEVVCHQELGEIYDPDEDSALFAALSHALAKSWNAKAIIGYATQNGWEVRIAQLLHGFQQCSLTAKTEHA